MSNYANSIPSKGNSVYIRGGLRTPIGEVQGQYKAIKPEMLGSRVLNQLRHTYKLERVDQIICGNAVGTGGNIGRLTSLVSAFPDTVPAFTVDMQCASAGLAVELAYAQIKAGLAETIIAGGIESSSLQPLRTYSDLDDRSGSYTVAQFSPTENDALAMLKGAERVIEKYEVSRDELNRQVLRSHQLAVQTKEHKLLESYILPVLVDHHYCVDESIRPTMNERLLNRMKPILGTGTLVTAGNACFTHDGAAFLVLSSEPSDFRIVYTQAWGGDPLYSPEGALHCTEQLLTNTGLSMIDIDAVEWNEAFAVIDVLFARNYKDHLAKYNQLGGALAYGHPYGASGAIILLHLMATLKQCQGHYGLAAIAGAGGTGTAILIERV